MPPPNMPSLVMAPVMERLQEENQDLREGLQRTVKISIDRELDGAVPNWRQINQDVRWFQWLAGYDVYSGYKRQELLNDAVNKADAFRVISIFRGFLREAAAGQPGQPGQVAGARQAAQPSGRIYTRDQITEMARRRQKGLIPDEEWRRWEYELCRASAEGRVRGALSLETGLPVTL
jgi:hypothetical protein